VNETSNYSNKALDFLPYSDPTNLNVTYNINQPRITNFKSDIYSIGILLWLLSSGRRPFYDEGTKYDINLAMDIINGKREEIIKGTPVEYSDIYTGNKFYASRHHDRWDGMIYMIINDIKFYF
jgi:serine/threonine protein kinase